MAMTAKERKQKQRASASGYAKSRRVDWSMQGIDRSFTYQDYLEMIVAQHSQCAMCACSIDSTSPLDHNHDTGHVRAVLCSECNIRLGHVEAGGALFLHNASEYLTRYASV